MAELYRKRYNGVDGVTLAGGGLTNSATSITFSAALQSMGANIATLATDEYLPLVIENEIVYLTAYTAAATTGTISRGKEGTTGAAHSAGVDVIHGLTVADIESKAPEVIGVALSDETTAITTGTAKATIRMPFAMTLTAVRASLTTASSSGIPTVDINEAGTTILSTKLTIDASETTSTTAATPAVISDAALADDAAITFDIDVAGTGATGLKVWLIGTRA